MQKFNPPERKDRKMFFEKVPDDLFLRFTQNLKMPAKNGGKTIFGKKWQMTGYYLWIKNFIEITRDLH